MSNNLEVLHFEELFSNKSFIEGLGTDYDAVNLCYNLFDRLSGEINRLEKENSLLRENCEKYLRYMRDFDLEYNDRR